MARTYKDSIYRGCKAWGRYWRKVKVRGKRSHDSRAPRKEEF